MNKVLFANKVQVLERLVLQDIVTSYGMQKISEASYDNLMAKLLDRITQFYEKLEPDALSLQKLKPYGDRAKIYTEQLRADVDKAAEVTVRQIIKQLPREKLSGGTLWDATQAVRPIFRRRMEVLSNLLDASTLQMKNYMLLWDYQDAGFTHYCLLTEGENCDDCNSLEGQIFPISEARVGENFAPMHPNCNCRVGILNDAGQVAYIIGEGKSEKKEEETNWYDAFLRMPQDAKELFLAFVRAQNERLGQKDIAGFLDWLTLGVVSGIWQGHKERSQELLNDPTLYNLANYLTFGFAGTVKGAIKPEEPLSLQHWLDTLGVVSTAFGAYQMGKGAKTGFSLRNSTRTVDTSQRTQRVYTANGDEALRSIRRPIFDDVLEKGIDINGTHFKMNKHAYNSLFKSGRKDIMPDDIIDALKVKPIPANPGSIEYVNPITGTSVFVNSTNNEIVGIWPAEFKK